MIVYFKFDCPFYHTDQRVITYKSIGLNATIILQIVELNGDKKIFSFLNEHFELLITFYDIMKVFPACIQWD